MVLAVPPYRRIAEMESIFLAAGAWCCFVDGPSLTQHTGHGRDVDICYKQLLLIRIFVH